ncbi:MAG: thiazole synthase [Elusimicrobia bacterium]|nr:thiazole synthase [Elusimicrobiota bacterium]MBD3412347.1 thiazole synthase [Elusimicrobiota bacterium]
MSSLTIAGKHLDSRLIIGTGKYPSFPITKQALEASGAAMVTVAVRRINIDDPSRESLLDYIDRKTYTLLPNTAGCYSAEEAVRTARLAAHAGLSQWIKLEVIGDPKTLLPDVEGLLAATRILVKEGFVVLPYTNDDPITAKKLQDAGAAAVMPLAAPIGSGLGILNRLNIEYIRDAVTVPVIVDAGVGTASDAAVAMEIGVDGILINTAIAHARDPVAMATAMNWAVKAGRKAYEAGRITPRYHARASSPSAGMVATR